MNVLYEDERYIAVSKPSGRPVIPMRGMERRESLRQELERLLDRKLWVVHRIDKDTSGIVLFAKDADSHRWACSQFEARRVEKKYLALVQGRVPRDGEIALSLRAFGSGRTAVAEDGKPSLTRYRVLERLAGATLVEVVPMTGRRHQIRAHFFASGHPVLGDPLYGIRRPVGGARRDNAPGAARAEHDLAHGASRLMLHARDLRWTDAQGRTHDVQDPPPADFLEILNNLRAQPI